MALLSFGAGFVSGWLVRSTVESSRDLLVGLGATYKSIVGKVTQTLVAEREFLEDLWAEVKTRALADDELAEEAEETEGEIREPETPSQRARVNGEAGV